MGDYSVSAFVTSPGLYIKDIRYSGVCLLQEPFRFGSAAGSAAIRVRVGSDGGAASIHVADKDGNPVPNASVAIMPASAAWELLLASQIISGQADQTGNYTSSTLPPGKYGVVAIQAPIDTRYESIHALWSLRGSKTTEIEIAPGANLEVTLEPTKID